MKIFYSADTGYDKNITTFFNNSDILIFEASFLKRQKHSNINHLSAEESAIIASKSNARRLVLTRLWTEIDKSEYVNEAKKIFQNVDVAMDGIEYVLKKFNKSKIQTLYQYSPSFLLFKIVKLFHCTGITLQKIDIIV